MASATINPISVSGGKITYIKKGIKITTILTGKSGEMLSRQVRSPKAEKLIEEIRLSLWIAKNLAEPPSSSPQVSRRTMVLATKREFEIAQALQ